MSDRSNLCENCYNDNNLAGDSAFTSGRSMQLVKSHYADPSDPKAAPAIMPETFTFPVINEQPGGNGLHETQNRIDTL